MANTGSDAPSATLGAALEREHRDIDGGIESFVEQRAGSMTGELEQRHGAGALADADVLEGNAMGIAYGDGTAEEKLGRLVALVPMALEVVDEARATIARLREENDRLHAENDQLKSALDRMRA